MNNPLNVGVNKHFQTPLSYKLSFILLTNEIKTKLIYLPRFVMLLAPCLHR